MTRHDHPTRIPCAVCLVPIDDWSDDDDPVAVPCGHTEGQIHEVGTRMVRVEFGQYVGSEAT